MRVHLQLLCHLSCPNFRPDAPFELSDSVLSAVIQQRDVGNANSCLCLRATLEEAESQLASILRNGLAVMVCLAVLTIMGKLVHQLGTH
jgi:hypothetical protein